MEIVCLGLSHQHAPIEVREKFAFPDGQLPENLARLVAVPGLGEAVIVSTCNRVELYAAAPGGAEGLAALGDFATEHAGQPVDDCFFRHSGPQAARHLFRVVAGLESMVLGETEILGQVKKAYQTAQTGGTTGRLMNKLFQRAFNVAKQVRTDTAIQRGSISVGSVAVELAEKIHGDLKACNVMILGAGETAELTAGALSARGVNTIFVANRSHDRAVSLAEKMSGKALHFDEWEKEFAQVDILIGSTAAPHHVVTAARLRPVMRTRQDRPLFCIDLAVPRDIEPEVNDLDGVFLYDIDALQRVAEESLAVRRQEVVACEAIIERHVAEFSHWLTAPRPDPTAGTMRRAQS